MAHCSFDSKDHIIGCYLDDKGQPSCISDFTAPDVGLGPRMGVAYSSHDQELTLWAVEQTGANAGHLWRFMKKAGQANSSTDDSATVGGFFTGR